jgi:hypothetical protein
MAPYAVAAVYRKPKAGQSGNAIIAGSRAATREAGTPKDAAGGGTAATRRQPSGIQLAELAKRTDCVG